MPPRIFLSAPHLSGSELPFVQDAFSQNWVGSLGPHVDAFEKEFAAAVGSSHAAAVSSGTAALHLALKLIGLQRGEEVFCSTLTFAASANPIVYEGGKPVFIDSERSSWNMDPARLEEALSDRAKKGRLPRAVILVHIYGQSADVDAVAGLCEQYGVPLIEDAAEALGATYTGAVTGDAKQEGQRPEARGPVSTGAANAGATRRSVRGNAGGPEAGGPATKTERGNVAAGLSDFRNTGIPIARGAGLPDLRNSGIPIAPGTRGLIGIYSLNGNKIITSSSGGMLVSHDEKLVARARFLATQARDPAPHYEHSVIGHNYRMSNIIAGIGRAQLRVLSDRVEARRRNFAFYQQALADVPGIEFMPEAPWGRSTRWLTCALIDPKAFGADRQQLQAALEAENIEARPVWKPMHRQPVFAGCDCFGGEVADDLFARGICLPSGSSLTEGELERVARVIRKVGRIAS